MLGRLAIFACEYGFSKCIRTAVCGLAVMLPLLIGYYYRRRKESGNADLHFYGWFLLFPAALTGMSKFFFQRWSMGIYGLSVAFGVKWVCVFYYAVMLSLAGWWLCGKGRLARRVRKLYCWHSPKGRVHGGTRDWHNCVRQVTAGDVLGLAGRYMNRARVYIAAGEGSPFCGGVFRPYIVMPEIYLEPASAESRGGEDSGQGYENRRLTGRGRVLLCHELLHLKAGHILWMNLFALLRIYWWINPVVYLCERALRQDMEQACDEGCLYYTGTTEREYGRLLLEVAAGRESVSLVGAATFLRDRDYHTLKSRIGNLRGKCGYAQYRRRHRAMGWGCGVVLALAVLAVGFTSYPRYTRLTELTLYDEELRMICNDTPQLRAAVQVVDGYLRIDPEGMDACLRDLDVQGSYVYLGYDTIMKVPGVGGGGNVGMIALEDYEDIFYLRAETWENDWMEFCLKYLL